MSAVGPMSARELFQWLVGSARGALAEAIARCHPNEACGLVVAGELVESAAGSAGPGGRRIEFLAVDNRADLLHAADPQRFPRTARTSYAIDVRDILGALSGGKELVAVVHSHPTGGLALSEEDLRLAVVPDGGGPAWPGVCQVVLDGGGGRLMGLAVHVWCERLRRFEVAGRWVEQKAR